MARQNYKTWTFNSRAELEKLIPGIDTVTTQPVHVNGVEVPHYKAVVYNKDKTTATIVSQRYKVIQHRDSLQEIHDALKSLNIECTGYITESSHGHIHAKVHFSNPEYKLQKLLNLTHTITGYLNLGIAINNTYGKPSQSLQVEALGYNQKTQQQYLWGTILGKRNIPHIGNVKTELKKVIQNLTKNAPQLGKHITEANQYKFTQQTDIKETLRGMGYGPQTTNKMMTQKDMKQAQTAWQVYNAITKYIYTRSISEATKDIELKRSVKILDPNRIKNLQTKGQQIILKEQLENKQKQLKLEA